MILEPGCDFCISTKDEHDWCTIFVPTQKLTRDKNLVKSLSSSEKMSCRVTRPNYHLANQFWGCLHQIFTTATYCSNFEFSPAAKVAEAELVKVIPQRCIA